MKTVPMVLCVACGWTYCGVQYVPYLYYACWRVHFYSDIQPLGHMRAKPAPVSLPAPHLLKVVRRPQALQRLPKKAQDRLKLGHPGRRLRDAAAAAGPALGHRAGPGAAEAQAALDEVRPEAGQGVERGKDGVHDPRVRVVGDLRLQHKGGGSAGSRRRLTFFAKWLVEVRHH